MASAETSEDIVRLYAAAFNRQPDPAGLADWNASADSGWTVPQIAQEFAASPEFILDYGSLDDPQFVVQLYANVLGRSPDALGANDWRAFIASGGTRGQVLNGFAQSDENVIRTNIINAPPAPAPPAIVVPPVAQPPATPPPAVTPPAKPPTPPVTPPSLPDPLITGTVTSTTPGSFTLESTSGTPNWLDRPAVLITNTATAEASTFTFKDFGGRVDISDLTFDDAVFKTNYKGQLPPSGLGALTIAGQAGGTVTLMHNGAPVGTLIVNSFDAVGGGIAHGIDPTNGYSWVAGG